MEKIIIPGNPLSDNHLYGHRAFGSRVIKYMSKKGKDYKILVDKCCRKPSIPTKKPIRMEIYIYFGDKRKRDIQGHLKALLDSFIGIIYDDDSQVYELYVQKEYDKKLPRSEVFFREILVKE